MKSYVELGIGVVTFVAVSDSDGNFPSLIAPRFAGRLRAMRVALGATLPTLPIDVALVHRVGADIFENIGEGIMNSMTEPVPLNQNQTVAERDWLTLNIRGNRIADARVVVNLWLD